MTDTTKVPDDGGPAFGPIERETEHFPYSRVHSGMSLRDRFAGLGMQAHVTGIYTDDETRTRMHELALQDGVDVTELVARAAYQRADAMIAQRKREQA